MSSWPPTRPRLPASSRRLRTSTPYSSETISACRRKLEFRLRDDLRAELQRLQAETDITMVYVTHDQTEALSLSSRIAVMNQGKVEQIGTPTEIYNFPATE